jgi:DNA-binding transcriptional MerR regulator
MIKLTSHTRTKTLPAASGTTIPDKLYFRIGDVAKLCGVEAYVLRFWESEFPQLKPNKSGTGQRLYRKRDVELALRIKHLLYADGYTIAGARQVFTAESRESKKATQSELPLKRVNGQTAAQNQLSAEKQLQKLRSELREILGILSSPVKEKTHSTSRGERRNDRTLFES